MKKLFLLSLCAVLIFAQNIKADFGSSFGGSLTGSLVGSAIGNAATRERTVVVRESDDVESSRSSRSRKRKMRELEEENYELKEVNNDLRKRLERLEDKVLKNADAQ